jgi:hypothetical protein
MCCKPSHHAAEPQAEAPTVMPADFADWKEQTACVVQEPPTETQKASIVDAAACEEICVLA